MKVLAYAEDLLTAPTLACCNSGISKAIVPITNGRVGFGNAGHLGEFPLWFPEPSRHGGSKLSSFAKASDLPPKAEGAAAEGADAAGSEAPATGGEAGGKRGKVKEGLAKLARRYSKSGGEEPGDAAGTAQAEAPAGEASSAKEAAGGPEVAGEKKGLLARFRKRKLSNDEEETAANIPEADPKKEKKEKKGFFKFLKRSKNADNEEEEDSADAAKGEAREGEAGVAPPEPHLSTADLKGLESSATPHRHHAHHGMHYGLHGEGHHMLHLHRAHHGHMVHPGMEHPGVPMHDPARAARHIAGVDVPPLDVDELDPNDPWFEILKGGPPHVGHGEHQRHFREHGGFHYGDRSGSELQQSPEFWKFIKSAIARQFQEQLEMKQEDCEAMKQYDIARLRHYIAKLEDEDKNARMAEAAAQDQQHRAEAQVGEVSGFQNLTESQEESVQLAEDAEREQEYQAQVELTAQEHILKARQALQRVEAHQCEGPEPKPRVVIVAAEQRPPSAPVLVVRREASAAQSMPGVEQVTASVLQQDAPWARITTPDEKTEAIAGEGELLSAPPRQGQDYFPAEPVPAELALDNSVEEGAVPPVLLALVSAGCATSCPASPVPSAFATKMPAGIADFL